MHDRLEDYIEDSNGSCTMNEMNMDETAICIAVDYSARFSPLVTHDKRKAKPLLTMMRLYEQMRILDLENKSDDNLL